MADQDKAFRWEKELITSCFEEWKGLLQSSKRRRERNEQQMSWIVTAGVTTESKSNDDWRRRNLTKLFLAPFPSIVITAGKCFQWFHFIVSSYNFSLLHSLQSLFVSAISAKSFHSKYENNYCWHVCYSSTRLHVRIWGGNTVNWDGFWTRVNFTHLTSAFSQFSPSTPLEVCVSTFVL